MKEHYVALEKLGKKHNSYYGAEIEWFILTKLNYAIFYLTENYAILFVDTMYCSY